MSTTPIKHPETITVTKIQRGSWRSMVPEYKALAEACHPLPFDIAVYNIYDQITEPNPSEFRIWNMFQASNGAFFLVQESKDQEPIIVTSPNGSLGELSPAEAGMLATIIALSWYPWRIPEDMHQRAYVRLDRLISQQANSHILRVLMD